MVQGGIFGGKGIYMCVGSYFHSSLSLSLSLSLSELKNSSLSDIGNYNKHE